MDDLILDAESLFNIADIIDGYCARQREVVNVYHAQILALESEWQDDETFGSLVGELNLLRAQALNLIDEIYETYPKYFRQRAQRVLERTLNINEGTPVYIPIPTTGRSTEYHMGNRENVSCEVPKVTDGSASSTEDDAAGCSPSRGFTPGVTGEDEPSETLFGKKDTLKRALRKVAHNPIQPAPARTETEIVSELSGGDNTQGSCSSLAFAYAGNKGGYEVLDFRDGQSRAVFASRDIIKQIATMQGVKSKIEYGVQDGICAERLMSQMEKGKEYYLATGRHAAIVRLDPNRGYQYLELQSAIPSDNGWHPLTQRALYERFCCQDDHKVEWSNYLIEIDSLKNNADFLHLLGYINTAKSAQVKE